MASLHPELERRDQRPIGTDESEIRLFGVLRDEMLRLPYFLDYYRRLGVARFFLISNASRDGSEDYLLQQPDCHVFHTDASYGKSRAGVTWLNSLLDAYGVGHWIVLADIDELLVYPDCEQARLPQLCRWLQQSGHEALYAVLLDMYSALPIRDVTYRQGEDFLAAAPLHDGDYVLVRRFGFPKPAFPPFEHIGGPRLRLCFGDQNTHAVWPRLKVKLARRAVTLARKAGLLTHVEPPTAAPQAFKVPLVRWTPGNAFINSHRPKAVKLAPLTGALLHFKYFQDFGARVDAAIGHGEHYAGSAEYKQYAALLHADASLSLAYPGSVGYRSSEGLVERHLILDDPAWASDFADGERAVAQG